MNARSVVLMICVAIIFPSMAKSQAIHTLPFREGISSAYPHCGFGCYGGHVGSDYLMPIGRKKGVRNRFYHFQILSVICVLQRYISVII